MPHETKETNWVVITGAPCSGKTSVIRTFEDMGYPVVHEAARALIDEGLATGMSVSQIKSDILAFESRILERKIAAEQRLPEQQTVFLDRAIPDSIAYYRLENLPPDIPLIESRRFQYRRVFLFERFGFKTDEVRSEDDQAAARIESLIETAYTALGYKIVHVPVMPVPARQAFVLETLGEVKNPGPEDKEFDCSLKGRKPK